MAADREPDVLIVAAHLPELSGLRLLLGDRLSADVGGVWVSGEAVGIGLPAAAGGMAARLERRCPRAVVLVGTCGAYEEQGVEIGDVVVGRRVHLASAAVALGAGAFPAPMSVVVEAAPALSDRLIGPGVRAVDVATTLAITIDSDLARALGRGQGCHVEHLEAFAVAQHAAAYRVPFAIVLGVANRCGPTARAQWREHQRRAGEGAASHVAAWLARGAPGLGAGGR